MYCIENCRIIYSIAFFVCGWCLVSLPNKDQHLGPADLIMLDARLMPTGKATLKFILPAYD